MLRPSDEALSVARSQPRSRTALTLEALATENRRPGQSWRTFILNQAIAFSYHEHPDRQSKEEYRGLLKSSKLMRNAMRSLSAAHNRRRLGRTLTPLRRGIIPRPGPRVRRGPLCTLRWNAAMGGFRKVRDNHFGAVPIRSPPYQACQSGSAARPLPNRDVAFSRRSSFEEARPKVPHSMASP
jgi:hypothetical protein